MRVYSHFAVSTLSNTYLVGLPSGAAILIDPAVFDGGLLEMIEHHSYTVSCILLTHSDEKHLAGLRTVMRVYSNVQVYAAMPEVLDLTAIPVTSGETLGICGGSVDVVGLPGYGRDCVAFLIGGFLFCGPALSAGELGAVSNPYAKAILLANIAESIVTLPDETVILPFYGPPTTVAVERRMLPTEDPRKLAGLA
ncbi:MAG: MBL fold metallo-hydrolase [Spirochaetia bacterium]